MKSQDKCLLWYFAAIQRLENRHQKRKNRPNSISNFRLKNKKKLDMGIYPMKPHKISLFSCLYPAKSAQVHTPMANFAEKNHPLHHVRKHFSQQRAGEYQYIHRSRKSPDSFENDIDCQGSRRVQQHRHQ